MDAFPLCLSFVLAREGGLVDHPQDPGGATNFGISQRAHPDQPQVVGLPIPLAALVLGQPLETQVQRAFALGRDLPFSFRASGACDQRKANQCQEDLPGHVSHRGSRSVRPGSPDDVDYPINSGSHLDRR